MNIVDCIFCIVAYDEHCPHCAGLGVAMIDPKKGTRPLTTAEIYAAGEVVTNTSVETTVAAA